MTERPAGEQPDIDSRNVPAPSLSGRGFPAPPAPPAGPGIGLPWLGLPASSYSPAGGTDPDHPHLFHLQAVEGNVWEAGGLQGAHAQNWPILAGQKGAVYLVRLHPGGVREPHWHPSGWEMNVVLAGSVRWSFVGPSATEDVFTGGPGDVIFAPQGHFHYFENGSETEDLLVLIVFNAETPEDEDDVALGQSLSSVPADALAAVFGVDPAVFAALPPVRERRPIVSKRR